VNGRDTSRGFTLVELMIAVAIAGIIAAIAYPSYQDQIRRTRRAAAQGDLTELSGVMERVFTENNSYTPGGTAPALPFTQSPKDGNSKVYNLALQASKSASYTLRATPIAGTSQAGDGFLQLANTGARGWDKNNDGDVADPGENTW